MNSTTYEFPTCRGPHRMERLAAIPVVALRLYLASIWLRFSCQKFAGGWLTTNPLKPLLTSVAGGQIPTTVTGYHVIARIMVATHADAPLSVAIPCMELMVGLALLFGIAPRITALVATGLNANLLLAGVGSVSLDGRMIVLQVILLAVATLLGPTTLGECFRWLGTHHASGT